MSGSENGRKSQNTLAEQQPLPLLPVLNTGKLSEKLIQQTSRVQANLMDLPYPFANEIDALRQKTLDNVTRMVTELEQTFAELSAAVKLEATSELTSFQERLKKEGAFQVDLLRSDIDSDTKAKRVELVQIAEQLCVGAVDELQLLRKRMLTDLNRHLSEHIESTKSSIQSSSDVAKKVGEKKIIELTQKSEIVTNEIVAELERKLKSKVANLSDDLEGRAYAASGRLEAVADSQLQSEFDKRLKIVKQDLNKALNATVADFSEQARLIVRSLSCGLRDDGEKRAEEAREEFDVVVKGAAKELQNDLSRMREEVMRSHFTNARNVLAELRKSSVKYEEIQGVLHEVSMKVEDLEISVKAGCDNVADLDDQFKNQMALAQQSIGDINSLVVRIEGSIGGLEQRAQAAFEKARMIVEQQIPETTHQAIREGRSQALLYSRGETAKEIHLVLGGLYAELRMLERDIREKVETVKTMVEDQKKSIIATTQKSGGESLSRWVAEKLSS